MTDKKTEALKLALEALEDAKKNHGLVYVTELCAIKEALAEQPAQDNTYTCGVCGVSVQMEKPRELHVIAGRKVTIDWKTQALELRELVRLGGIKISELEAALSQSRSDDEQPAQDQGQSCYCPECERLSKELAAFKAQQQEPVAYMNQNGVIHPADYEWEGTGNILTPLYTSPPIEATPLASQSRSDVKPWVGLTKEERVDFTLSCGSYETVCSIEAKLKAKNSQ